MRKSAAVLCQDKRSLQTLETTLEHLDIEMMRCQSGQEALEFVMNGRCTTLIVDFDLPGAQEAIRMGNLLPPMQKPALLALASRAWPGTGQAFQSGPHLILYRPLDGELLAEALKACEKTTKIDRRKSPRLEAQTLVYLELDGETLAGVSIDIGEHGLALQATKAVPMVSSLAFRCMLPGTNITIHGHADVIWASDQGRAGLFFSRLGPEQRRHLKNWVQRRGTHQKNRAVRTLLPPADAHVEFAHVEDEVQAEVQK